MSQAQEEIVSEVTTTCCVVGGGPGGVILSYLLARQGIDVTLLEAHHDFDRDFRGDTIHPSTMEILDQLGLADDLLRLPHGELRQMNLRSEGAELPVASFHHLKTRFPYVTMMPQVDFLNFMVEEARRYPSFRLVLGANVQRLVEENGIVRGVRYRADDGWHEVRALQTVGADGRFSKLRSLLELEPIETAPPMDVLWFRLPRADSDPESVGAGIVGRGKLLVMLPREEEWQIGYVFPKGGYRKLKEAGLPKLREDVAGLAPWLADRVERIEEWSEVALLSVASNRLKRWYQPGILLIGDAAHVMSPVGGVGINYAVQDAVVTANVLSEPLRQGRVRLQDLAEVQRRRSFPTRFIQAFQRQIQQRVVSQALNPKPFRIPLLVRWLLKLPGLRALPARLIGYGWSRVEVEHLERYRSR